MSIIIWEGLYKENGVWFRDLSRRVVLPKRPQYFEIFTTHHMEVSVTKPGNVYEENGVKFRDQPIIVKRITNIHPTLLE